MPLLCPPPAVAVSGLFPDHDLPDLIFEWPDVLDALSAFERQEAVDVLEDVCVLHRNRYFIRGVLQIEVHQHEDPWGLGLWVEVSRNDCIHFLLRYSPHTEDPPAHFKGRIANELTAFLDAQGSVVEVCPGKLGQLSTLWFPRKIPGHSLCEAHMSGMSIAQIHKVIEIVRTTTELPARSQARH